MQTGFQQYACRAQVFHSGSRRHAPGLLVVNDQPQAPHTRIKARQKSKGLRRGPASCDRNRKRYRRQYSRNRQQSSRIAWPHSPPAGYLCLRQQRSRIIGRAPAHIFRLSRLSDISSRSSELGIDSDAKEAIAFASWPTRASTDGLPTCPPRPEPAGPVSWGRSVCRRFVDGIGGLPVASWFRETPRGRVLRELEFSGFFFTMG